MVSSGFWLFDMSDEVREHYPPRPGECMSQLHNNTATLTTLHRDDEVIRVVQTVSVVQVLLVLSDCCSSLLIV